MGDLINSFEKFKHLVRRSSREGAVERIEEEGKEEEVLDPDAEIKQALGGWVMDERVRKHFIPWLEQEMERMVQTAHLNHASHAQLATCLGIEQGLRIVRDKLISWARG